MSMALYNTADARVLAEESAACALKQLEAGASRVQVLTSIVTAAERLAGDGCVASILVIDDEGQLRNGASPNLPADYLAAIDRLRPNARVGTCAAAAATGEPVFTPDFCADEKWAELRHLPMALGFQGAWSMPIKAGDGRVLGTLGTYYRDHRSPTADEVEGINALASVAAEAICRAV
jgi:GAF domain-containing protein